MDLTMTDEQRMIRDEVARFLANAGGLDAAARVADGAGDAALWSGLSVELGLAGVAIAEEAGGLGLGMTELVLIAAEVGRVLAPVPYISTVGIAAQVLAHAAAGPEAARLLSAIASGAARAVVVASGFDDFTACRAGADIFLTGRSGPVVDLAGADTALVPAMLDGKPALFAVPLVQGITPLDAMDRTRPLARLDLAGVAGVRVDAPDFAVVFHAALDRARLALAAEAVGAARGAYDLTLRYITDRVQFGRPIASFQAIKHRMADLFVRLNTAEALVVGTAMEFDHGDAALAGAEALAAWAMARDVAQAVAAEAVQLHGGVGITWEYAPHLFLKRAFGQHYLLNTPEQTFAGLGAALMAGDISAMPAASDSAPIRAQASDWLARHLTDRFLPLRNRGHAGDGEALVELRKAWEAELASGGWVGLGLPVSVGGRGMSVADQVIFNEEYARAGGPGRMGHIGEGLVAPTLMAFGTEDQKARFLPGILAGTAFWAQGYSEPGAGSDLAAVRTRARLCPDTGDWLVTGQKTWTSLAQYSDWIFVLARAVDGSVGREGLILLLMPLDQPEIEIRPIRQINGGAEFNETFFDGARAKAADAIGAPGEGWKIATTLLGFERGISTLGQQMGFARELAEVAGIMAQNDAVHLAERLGRAWAGLRAMRHGALRMLGAQARGQAGPEVLGYKYEWSNWHRSLGELALAAMGPMGAAMSDDPARARLQHMFLFARSETIYGGTNEIQLNIIAEQGLKMPREARGPGKPG